MKTAIIFYGFFRTFEYCYDSMLEHVIYPLNCDVFFNSPKNIYLSEEDAKGQNNLVVPKINDIIGSRLKHYEIRDYDYDFYKYKIQQAGIPEANDFTKQINPRVLSQLHSFQSSINTFNNFVNAHHIKYDLVIMCRTDMKFYKQFNIKSLDRSKLNCPLHFLVDFDNEEIKKFSDEEKKRLTCRTRTHGASVHGFNRWLNDNILVASQNLMLNFNNVYDKAIYYHKMNGVCFNNETILGYHMLSNNMDWCGTDFIIGELWRLQRKNY